MKNKIILFVFLIFYSFISYAQVNAPIIDLFVELSNKNKKINEKHAKEYSISWHINSTQYTRDLRFYPNTRRYNDNGNPTFFRRYYDDNYFYDDVPSIYTGDTIFVKIIHKNKKATDSMVLVIKIDSTLFRERSMKEVRMTSSKEILIRNKEGKMVYSLRYTHFKLTFPFKKGVYAPTLIWNEQQKSFILIKEK